MTTTYDAGLVVKDRFNRSVSNGWGTPSDKGGAWVVQAGSTASNFDTVGSGRILVQSGAGNSQRIATTDQPADFDLYFTWLVDVLPLTANLVLNVFGRLGVGNVMNPYIVIAPSGALSVGIAGSDHTPAAAAGSYSGGGMRAHVRILGPTVSLSTWASGGSEPATFQVSDTDSDARTSGLVGLDITNVGGVTNTPRLIVDDLDLYRAALGPWWGTHFALPPAVSGLASAWDRDTSWMTLAWTAYASDPALFWRNRIYRQVGSGDLIQIDRDALSDPAIAQFVDYDAPVGVPLTYVVTVDNGAYESAPSAGSTVSDLIAVQGWYIVTPGDSEHSFKVRYVVPSPRRNPRTSKTVRDRLSGSTPVITSGPVRRPSGTLTVEIRLPYHDQVALLREIEEYCANGNYVVLKNTDGESFRVLIDSWEETLSSQLFTQMTCNWWAVE